MRTTQLRPFGFEVTDVDLAAQLTDPLIEGIEELLHRDGLVVFRHQDMSDEDQTAFASRFGKFTQLNPEDRESFTYRINNTEGFGAVSELPFHSDNAWTQFPLKYIMLYGLDVTTDGAPLQGGETILVNASDALDRLPATLVEELSTLQCHLRAGRSDEETIRHCIEAHPRTTKPYIVLNELCVDRILGVDEERQAELLEAAYAALYDEAGQYWHGWHEGDLVMWDNRAVQHRRGHYDLAQRRVLRRSAIADDFEPTAISPY